jgi:propionate catabolism operon transcriptional regulator
MTTRRFVPSSFTAPPWLELGTDLRAALESDAPVLITGHRDVGRLVARALHDRAALNREVDFVDVPHDALYEKIASLTADTLSSADWAGESARCTLFVGEIDQLPPPAQEMLHYFLDVAYAAAASAESTSVPAVRVVTATSDALSERVAAGLFRADLYYRLNVVHLAMPPVWDVEEDSQVHALLAALEA